MNSRLASTREILRHAGEKKVGSLGLSIGGLDVRLYQDISLYSSCLNLAQGKTPQMEGIGVQSADDVI